MALSVLQGDYQITGTLVAGNLVPSSGSVVNASVSAAAGITYNKVEHLHALNYVQPHGSNVAAAVVPVYVCRAAGTFLSVEAAVTGVAAGGDRTASVDVQISTGGGAPATGLSAPILFDSGDALRSVQSGVVTGTLADGDLVYVVVTLGGSSGTQPQGLLVTVIVKE